METTSNPPTDVEFDNEIQPNLDLIGQKKWEPDVDLESECFMVWEVDGRQARNRSQDESLFVDRLQYSNVSRRIRFWWMQRDGKIQESYILFVPPPDPMVPNTDGYLRRRGAWANAEFLARDFHPEKSQHATIRSWIDICAGHGEKCRKKHNLPRFHELREQTWFGVIDVHLMRLCRLPGDAAAPGPGFAPYFALSYVWGRKRDDRADHRTLRANVAKRILPGGIEERDLPETIRQAIQLTRDLGFKFIWIDSLCIVQDSYPSRKLNVAKMDLVYSNAHLTICAADGDSAEDGLTALNPEKADTPLKAEYSEGITLLVSRPSESVIGDSVWNQRGWTFQERIMSPRCLIFAGGRFYFQCRKGNMSQDIYPDATGTGLSMDWKNSPLRTLDGLDTRPIWFYMNCVSLYTGRHLSIAEDILAAFEGVASLMGTRMHGDQARFVYGLPPSHFDLALLWEPLSAQRRRSPSNADAHGRIDNDLPSWSWAGWMDASNEKKGSPVKYRTETLEGCFVDVREWLKLHTWIKWFIRNDSGDLRPIWDKRLMSAVEGVLERWRGYADATYGQMPVQDISDQFHGAQNYFAGGYRPQDSVHHLVVEEQRVDPEQESEHSASEAGREYSKVCMPPKFQAH